MDFTVGALPKVQEGYGVGPYFQKGLNFTTTEIDNNNDVAYKRARTIRDPQSHRIIEKRRRDRMNNCLADLSQLIPVDYLKHGQGRIEKTEIIEMAIQRINFLQNQVQVQQYREEELLLVGFKECRDQAIRYLVEKHGQDSVGPICMGLLLHLQEKQSKLGKPGADDEKTSDVINLADVIPVIKQEVLTSDIDLGAPQLKHEIVAVEVTPESMEPEDDDVQYLANEPCDMRIVSAPHDISCSLDRTEYGKRSDNPMSEHWHLDASGNSFTNGEQCKRVRTYKFKDEIRSRFSEDAKGCIHGNDSDCDSASNVSLSNDGSSSSPQNRYCHGSSSSPQNRYCHPQRDSRDDHIRHEACPMCHRNKTSECYSNSCARSSSFSESMDLDKCAPGFALHPDGTFYIPIITPVSQLGPFIQKYSTNSVCHPVSISVNFGGPFVSMIDHTSASNGNTSNLRTALN